MHKEQKRILFQIGLFVVTFVTTTLAGSQWVYGRSVFLEDYSWQDFNSGLAYSIPLLLILSVHEFGHYFLALYHKVRVSLPYYIPFPPIPLMPFNFGTMGAVIRLRERPASNVQNFDIGIAGPLAGFVVTILLLVYGFRTLPPPEYIYQFHPEYEQYGPGYADVVYSEEYARGQGGFFDVTIGPNLVFWIFGMTIADPARMPNSHEIMHYPILLACYMALFFTCMNLLPIGQLDGGHVVYGLFGHKTHRTIGRVFYIGVMFYAGLGAPFIDPTLESSWLLPGIGGYLLFLFIAFKGLHFSQRETLTCALVVFMIQFSLMSFMPGIKGYEGWLLFLFLVGRFVGVEHPRSEIEQPLDPRRTLLGWIALVVFILCFSPAPIRIAAILGE
jgi:membrane-associated protease RseP (regulator of RpoE activity)